MDVVVNWSKDVDSSFAKARKAHQPLLLDFSASPA
jgi:hypothetical protein